MVKIMWAEFHPRRSAQHPEQHRLTKDSRAGAYFEFVTVETVGRHLSSLK